MTMTISVNGESHPWSEGMTIEQLLEEKRFSFPLKTVFLNKRRIPKGEHSQTEIQDGDKIDVVHLMSGG